jgi:hypothetical protein
MKINGHQRNWQQSAPANYKGCSDNLEKNIFDYFVDYIRVGYGLPRSGAHRRILAQIIGNARGLDINSPRSVENHSQDL